MNSKVPIVVNEKYGSIDTDELLKNIQKYRKLDLRYESDDAILSHLKKIIAVKYNMMYVYIAGTELYRIRKLPKDNQRFLKKSDLLYPPVENIRSIGRLNNVNESLLYTGFQSICLMNEVKVLPDEEFAHIKYKVKDGTSINLSSVGLYDIDHAEMIKNNMFFDESRKKFTIKARINYDIIHDFLNSEFTRDVGTGTEFLYKTSNLIVKNFFDSPEVDGFLYPSVASKKGFNVALKPHAVDRAIEIVGVQIEKFVGEYEKGTRANVLTGVWSNKIVDDNIIYYHPDNKCPIVFSGADARHWYGPLPK